MIRIVYSLLLQTCLLQYYVNLYHVTKIPLNLCFTVHYFYPKISRFTLVLFITVVLDFF